MTTICRIGQYAEGESLTTAAEFSSRVLATVYMGTVNSSSETRQRAKKLSKEIGTYHMDVNIDTVVAAITSLFATITGRRPAFKVGTFFLCILPSAKSSSPSFFRQTPQRTAQGVTHGATLASLLGNALDADGIYRPHSGCTPVQYSEREAYWSQSMCDVHL